MAGTWRLRGLLLVAVAAGGMAAWLALRGEGTEDQDAPTHGGRDAPERVETGPLLQGTKAAPSARAGRGAITGRVTQAGRAVAAEVEVFWRAEVAAAKLRAEATTPGVLARFALPPPSELARSRVMTGDDGRFEAPALAPGAYEVRARTTDGARGEGGVLVPLDGARVHVEIAVAPANGVLRGRIQQADGSAYRGAAFVNSSTDEYEPWPISLGAALALDVDGAFEVRNLPMGKVRLQAVDPSGVWVRSPNIALPTSEPYVFTLGAEPGRVGRVVARDDGTPIPGAVVIGSAYPTEGGSILLHTSTDAEGRWRLALPAKGLYAVRAQAPGFAMLRLEREELPTASRPIELSLAREAVLTGRVIAATDGRPVPGVSVRVLPQGRYGDYFAPPAVVSDAQGRYEVRGLPPGSATVLAEGAGWAPARLVIGWRSLTPDATSVDLVAGRVTTRDLEVEAAGRIRGRVLDTEGAPLAGAVVWAEGRQGPRTYSSAGAHENLAPPSVTTDAEGAFVLEGLAASAAHVLLARSPAGQQAHSPLVRVGPEPQQLVEIRFVTRRTVEFRVEHATTGAPIVAAYVRPAERDEPGAPILRDMPHGADTQADGTARLSVPVGAPCSFDVSAAGFARAEGVPVAAEQAAVLVRLVPSPSITGQVLHADGSPASGDVRGFVETKSGWDQQEWVRTDANGSFWIGTPGAKPLRLRASVTGANGVLVGEAHATLGDAPVSITVRPIAEVPPTPGVLRVRVLDPAGAPVPGGSLEFVSRGGPSTDVTQGWAEVLEPAWAGETIVVSRAHDEDGIALPVGPGRLGPLRADQQEVELRLPPELAIEGVVRTADGRGVGGAWLTAMAREREGGAGFLYAPDVWSDGEGRFRIGSLGPGAYDIVVKTRAHGLRAVRDVAAGRHDVIVTVDEGTRAAITVVDDEGRPVAGAMVRARSGDGSKAQEAKTDARGIAHLTGLPTEEDLQLRVESDEDEELGGTTIEAWRPADTTVRVPTLRIVSGRVEDSAGRPLLDVSVDILASGSSTRAATDRHGRFRYPVEGPGEIKVRVQEGDETPVEVPFLGEPLVLVLDAGVDLSVRVAGWGGSHQHQTIATLLTIGTTATHVREAPIDTEGIARFQRLKPDTVYALWIPPQADGRSLLLRDVRPTSGPLQVALREGRSIRGKVLAPAGADIWIQAHLEGADDIEVRGTVGDDGTYEIAGLPEGRWVVQVTAEANDRIYFPNAVLEAGATHDFDLTQQR
jgi:protocatechuate 3,4-dioxygenase beta subunit